MLQIALFAQKALFAPKVLSGPKKHFWARKVILEPKVHFSDFGPKWLHLSFVLKVFGAKCKDDGFHVQISKNVEIM